jgi:nucleoside diphosphate-linked moiety X motif protein 19
LSSKTISLDEVVVWREKVSKDPNEFVEFCDRFELNPDLWSLYEWWNWLTPSSVGRNPRFDSIFYICTINGQPTSESNNWCSPRKLLDGHIMQKYLLSPPQVYELSRLLNFFTIEELSEFSAKRQELGIERWIPMIAMYSDGAISTLPGI